MPLVAVGVIGATLHGVILPIVTGASTTSYLGLALFLATGMRLIGSAVGGITDVVETLLFPIGRVSKIAATGVATFLATLAAGSVPGLIGGLGRATSVALAVAAVLTLLAVPACQGPAPLRPPPGNADNGSDRLPNYCA